MAQKLQFMAISAHKFPANSMSAIISSTEVYFSAKQSMLYNPVASWVLSRAARNKAILLKTTPENSMFWHLE